MSNVPSTPIKIAAFFFLVGGLLTLATSAIDLTNSVTNQASSESLRGAVNQVIQIVTVLSSILSILVGWFLIKVKRWSYLLGITLMICALGIHILTLVQVGTTKWYGLVLSVVILILLIAGKKNFSSNKPQSPENSIE